MRTSTRWVRVPPSRSISPLLEHAQDLGLGHEREVGHLVEEQRAAVGQLEAALLAAGRAREGALLVAEQLGLQQGLGQRRAVDGHEGPALARRPVVDGPGEQLLAGTALALDEHGGRGVGDLLDQGHQPPEHGAGPDDLALGPQVVELLLQRAVPLDEVAPFQRLVDELEQLLAAERLGEEVVGAVLHRLHGLLHRPERGQQDDVHVGRDGLGRPQQLEPGQARHLEVGDDEVDPAGLEALEGRAPVGGEHDPVALARQRALEALAQSGVVVGDEQRGEGLRHGSPPA
jgi:hypothetical protein